MNISKNTLKGKSSLEMNDSKGVTLDHEDIEKVNEEIVQKAKLQESKHQERVRSVRQG